MSRGGKDQSIKTKHASWQKLSKLMKDKGCLVEQAAQSMGSKMGGVHIQGGFRLLQSNCQGISAEGDDAADADHSC